MSFDGSGFQAITYEQIGKKVVITLNRPEVLNAVNRKMDFELHEAFKEIRDNPEVWVGIITGSGSRAFSAGHDMKEDPFEDGGAVSARREAPALGGIQDETKIWKPMIAAINGYCLGGGLEIALACDVRIAADRAEFGLPEVRWNLLAAGGGLSRLPQAIPSAAAMKLILTGERVGAQQALQWGLVTDVTSAADLMPLAHRIADRMLENAPLAMQYAKMISVRSSNVPIEDSLAMEQAWIHALHSTDDYKEGLAAFVERRPPKFKGS